MQVTDATTATARGKLAARAPGAGRGADQDTPGGPIIVLTYAHAGAELLTHALSASPLLACTSGTGLLPLCHSAAVTWRRIEGQAAVPTVLAMKSIRNLASTMDGIVRARSGASRWCETAFVGPAAAETFLQVFPATTFLCFHRRLQAVLAEGLRTYALGLAGSPFWPYGDAHPGNSVATIAAYWAACTEPLLDFEATHPQACLRVRHEDLAADPHHRAGKIFSYLGLDTQDLTAQQRQWRDARADATPVPPLPPDLIPPQLLAKVVQLDERLGYPS